MPRANNSRPSPPKWFRADNYKEKTKTPDPNFWLHALLSRSQLIAEIQELISSEQANDFSDKKHRLLAKLKELASVEESASKSKSTAKSVTHPTMGVFNSIWETVNAKSDYKSLCNPKHLNDSAFFELYERPINELFPDLQPPSHDSRVFAQIDMAFSDQKIKADFDDWLRQYRKSRSQNQPSQTTTEADLKKWHEQMLLPYIDLYLWQLLVAGEAGAQEWSHADYEEVLFLDDTQDKVRRTIHPSAIKLLSWATIRDLMLMSSPVSSK